MCGLPRCGSAWCWGQVPKLAQTWEQQCGSVPADIQEGDSFVVSAAVAPDWAVAGAEKQVSSVDPGAAYLFRKTADGWLESTKLMASDAQAGDLFGGSVAMSGSRVIVGAPEGESVWGPWSWGGIRLSAPTEGFLERGGHTLSQRPEPGRLVRLVRGPVGRGSGRGSMAAERRQGCRLRFRPRPGRLDAGGQAGGQRRGRRRLLWLFGGDLR